MLVSEISRGGGLGYAEVGQVGWALIRPDLGMFYCKQMSATQCLTMDSSPDHPTPRQPVLLEVVPVVEGSAPAFPIQWSLKERHNHLHVRPSRRKHSGRMRQ